MTFSSEWSRRRFLSSTAAAATLAAIDPALSAQKKSGLRSAAHSPEEIAGKTRGLMTGQTQRPLRYEPADDGFVIRNGSEFFNRPLYGPNNPFRVDAGDLPEFSLYLPGHGGNLRLGIGREAKAKWLFEAEEVIATYGAGRMAYAIRDAILSEGALHVELFTMGQGSGLHVRVQAQGVPSGARLLWAFGGVSGRKGKRGGDIGCESEPITQFFQVRPRECLENRYTIRGNHAVVEGRHATLSLTFPADSHLLVGDGGAWDAGWPGLQQTAGKKTELPVLIGSLDLREGALNDIEVRRVDSAESAPGDSNADAFSSRRQQLEALSRTVVVATPDPFVSRIGDALSMAADAIWDDRQRCVMHGAVAWRVALAGWRGPYVLDALGWHERFRDHARHWIARQNLSEVTTATPATGRPDPGSHLARSENMLHSRGDISHNHYDMNLVFFDAVLRHLRWTGDKAFAREIWPALVCHLVWERRLFRRTYPHNGRELPLYEGYACIWASDNLQYNGGGAAHSTAYNFFANEVTAKMARWIGEDPQPFLKEAELILAGMRELLWLPQQGTFGESKDILTSQHVYASPALWSVYHTIDSEVPTPHEAWQMLVERLAALKHVPVHGPGVPEGGWYMLACSDWLPYIWSLNLLLLGENMHFALALWQAGMPEEAFRIFKGNLLDSMFQGLCPGNFHMTSQLDDHRQEAQRDFGDPIGMTSRALIEGLFGIRPNLIEDKLILQPGFPAEWNHASIHHRDIAVEWRREEGRERFHIVSKFPSSPAVELRLRAPRVGRPRVVVNGREEHAAAFDPEAVGAPQLVFSVAKGRSWTIEVEWRGERVSSPPPFRTYAAGETMELLRHVPRSQIRDPQGCLRSFRIAALPGVHTIFLEKSEGDCRWWMPVSFEVLPAVRTHTGIPRRPDEDLLEEPLDLSPFLKDQITEIFLRRYDAPRSPFCSLSIPEQGAGAWAAFDLQPAIDDRGLRAAGGLLKTPMGVSFRTPAAPTPNCRFLSQWQQDSSSLEIPLAGKARSVFLLMAGSTFPQCSRERHATVQVRYHDGGSSVLALVQPANWWPIEQDLFLDDYLFVSPSAIPPRVDLRTGEVRMLDPQSFKGKGRAVPGGTACLLELPLDEARELSSLRIEVHLYGIVVALLAATLMRPRAVSQG